MSFGVSPSDVLKLVEFSTRVYVAFKDANDNSEAQVEGLVREFSTFHHCLVELDQLMREYGKPLPFPYLDFKETLQKCDKTLKPYAANLVDSKKMTMKKFTYTIKYIGKEKEIDGLRKQINGHYQALQMCISFLQLRLHLEATKQTQRLLDSVPFRSLSIGNFMYSSNAFASSSRAQPNALPPPSDADELYKDWLIFNRWLKNEDDRFDSENNQLIRPLSLGASPALAPSGNAETAAVLYHLRRELEDAILIEENRAKRVAQEKRTHLSPNDPIRQEIRNMPQVPHRTYTLDTDFTSFNSSNMADSTATIQGNMSPNASTTTSPTGSPQIPQGYFNPVDWGHLSPNLSLNRSSSVSTARTSTSTGSESHPGVHGISTAGTTPDDRPLRSQYSTISLATMALGESALTWTKLARHVHVERDSSKGVESRECDLHWRYREDAGLTIRSVYRSTSSSNKEVKIWVVQNFPATGPSIPLTTSYPDGETSIDFPRASFGKLDKRCTDIKYTFSSSAHSIPLQTLLYTNNGRDVAELLFDRPVVTISSDKNKPECRGKNIRLWRRTEMLDDGFGSFIAADVLVLLFYTSAIEEGKAHWVEEPHYVFQWLEEKVYKTKSDKLTLTFSKDPGRFGRDKVFCREGGAQLPRRESDSSQRTAFSTALQRRDTVSSVESGKSGRGSIFGRKREKTSRGDLNRFG